MTDDIPKTVGTAKADEALRTLDAVRLLAEGLDRLAMADAAHVISQTPGATGMKVARPDGQTLELHGPAILDEATHQLAMAHAYLMAALAASNIELAMPLPTPELLSEAP
jgi:hypothetical protein